MTLAYLLEENIAPAVAEQMRRENPEIRVESVHRWHGGLFVGQTDETLLRAAAEAGLTLVTGDRKTLPSLLEEWASDGENHAGVVFVDAATIPGADSDGLAAALLAHWRRYGHDDWTSRIAYLTRLR